MTRFPIRPGVTLLAVLCTGCASVPEVESRLQTLQFHPNMYVVQAGDTLETIAFRYELSGAELAALNPGTAAAGLTPGLRINVRPGTDLPDAVRAGSAWRGDARADRDTALARPATSVAPASAPAAVTRAVPRAVVATPMPIGDADTVSRATNDAWRDPIDVRTSAPGDTGIVSANYAERPVRPPVAGSAYPREEVLPDDYDIGPDRAASATLDAELQRYVGRWAWPTEGAVARGYEPERIGGQGVDIAGAPGQDVRAALDGTVVYSGRDLSGEGNLVIVRHDDDLMTTYSHADQLFVAEDDRVLAGDAIASLGGNERGESVLGFEVRRNGSPLDPMAFLPPRR